MRGSRGRARRLGSVCTTIAAKTTAEMAAKAAAAFALGTDLVELRVDLLKKPEEAASGDLAHLASRSVLTVRRKEEGGGFVGEEEKRLALITRLVKMRPRYLDIELSTAKENGPWLASLPKRPTRVVSWHDFSGTGETGSLAKVRKEASAYGEIVKLVTTAKTSEDNWKVLRLYQDDPHGLVAFCMGEAGTVSRLVSLQLGPIAYAALPNEQVAPGQLPVTTMVELKRLWEGVSW